MTQVDKILQQYEIEKEIAKIDQNTLMNQNEQIKRLLSLKINECHSYLDQIDS